MFKIILSKFIMLFSANTAVSGIWDLFMKLFAILINGFGSLYEDVFNGLGFGLGNAFQAYGIALGKYGIWTIVMLVISIGIALIVLYGMEMIITPEKDIDEAEQE